MMIIDGEILEIKCHECGHKFGPIIGYGPCAPNEIMRRGALLKNPPKCNKCGSTNVSRITFLNRILDIFR